MMIRPDIAGWTEFSGLKAVSTRPLRRRVRRDRVVRRVICANR